MEEKRFTLRITDKESTCIDEAKNFIPTKSDASTIRYMILHYKELADKLQEEQKKNRKLSDAMKKIEEQAEIFIKAAEFFNEYKKKK